MISTEQIAAYLGRLHGEAVGGVTVRPLGGGEAAGEKVYGYGVPLRVEYRVGSIGEGQRRVVVLHTMRAGAFGHERMADRAGVLIWSHGAFGLLPRHVRSLDVGVVERGGELRSVGNGEEYFLLTEFVEGTEYAGDLARLRRAERAGVLDAERADALCDYLVEIHGRKHSDRGLYARRVRELVGHGECVMGLIDSYPSDHPWITPGVLASIEQRVVGWRWKLKPRVHRLAQVHGDFHPWNILFQAGTEFRLLDRSRGEWGDPVDDVTSLTLNYVFESLQGTARLGGALGELFGRFWRRYLERSGDGEMLEVAGPYVVFRALVMASPVWYPNLDDAVRRGLFALIDAALEGPRFEPGRMGEYLQGV